MGKCFVVFLASTMIHPACYKMLLLHVYDLDTGTSMKEPES